MGVNRVLGFQARPTLNARYTCVMGSCTISVFYSYHSSRSAQLQGISQKPSSALWYPKILAAFAALIQPNGGSPILWSGLVWSASCDLVRSRAASCVFIVT